MRRERQPLAVHACGSERLTDGRHFPKTRFTNIIVEKRKRKENWFDVYVRPCRRAHGRGEARQSDLKWNLITISNATETCDSRCISKVFQNDFSFDANRISNAISSRFQMVFQIDFNCDFNAIPSRSWNPVLIAISNANSERSWKTKPKWFQMRFQTQFENDFKHPAIPHPQPPYHPQGGLTGIYIYIFTACLFLFIFMFISLKII